MSYHIPNLNGVQLSEDAVRSLFEVGKESEQPADQQNASQAISDVLPNFNFGNKAICSYCGDVAAGIDHVIPISYQTNAKERRRLKHRGPYTWACAWCNSHLGNRGFDTFQDRCLFVRDSLNRRAKPIQWHYHELERLDYTVRTLVEQEIIKRKLLRLRADWYESRDFYLNLENLLWSEHGSLAGYFASMVAFLKELAR